MTARKNQLAGWRAQLRTLASSPHCRQHSSDSYRSAACEPHTNQSRLRCAHGPASSEFGPPETVIIQAVTHLRPPVGNRTGQTSSGSAVRQKIPSSCPAGSSPATEPWSEERVTRLVLPFPTLGFSAFQNPTKGRKWFYQTPRTNDTCISIGLSESRAGGSRSKTEDSSK